MTRPVDGQKVEILLDGSWQPATFFSCDSIAPNDLDGDELWWFDYFMLEDGSTIPEDIHEDDELPPWRPRNG